VRKIEKSMAIEKSVGDIWNTLTEFSGYRSWNPIVKHAVIYGPVAAGTGIKALVGKWDFEFTITKAHAPGEFEMRGSSVGINLRLCFNIDARNGQSIVRISAYSGGWISRVFKKKVRVNLEDSLEIFLNSLKKKVLSGGSYEIKREDAKHDRPESDDISMPTPFNLVYKTRSRKFRKGGSSFE
jgi:hypothetical protein